MMNVQTAHTLVEDSVRYSLEVEREYNNAKLMPADYIRGYLDGYEKSKGILNRVLTKVCDILDIAYEPAKIVGFRKGLEDKIDRKYTEK